MRQTAGTLCVFLEFVLSYGSFPFPSPFLPSRRYRKPLVRQAKLGVSCRVKDPVRTRPNQPFVPSVAVMKEDAKFGSRSDRRIEKISALKKGRQRLQRAWKSCECDGKTGTQTSAVSDRTTSLKRTQGTT